MKEDNGEGWGGHPPNFASLRFTIATLPSPGLPLEDLLGVHHRLSRANWVHPEQICSTFHLHASKQSNLRTLFSNMFSAPIQIGF